MPPLPEAVTRAIRDGGRGLTVLVVRLGALGDIVRTLPAVRLARRAAPEARFHWILDEAWSAALEGHPDLEGLLTVPRRQWTALARSPGGWPRLIAELRSFRRRARALNAGLLLEFHGNLRSGVIAALTGAPVRLGFSGHQQKEGNRLFTTHRVPSGDRRTPRMERNLDLVRALGIACSSEEGLPPCDLPLARRGSTEAAAIVEALAPRREGFAVLSPGASAAQAYKKPPAKLMAAACDRLAAQEVTPLVVWGPGERPDARAVCDASPLAVEAPATSLAALVGLLARARLFVGGDSGPLHLACAAGCPVLGVYGPTDPLVNRPWGVPFRVVHPAGRRYTGIKRRDREAGGFDGLDPARLDAALVELLAATAL